MLLIAYVKLCKAENKLVFELKPRYNRFNATNHPKGKIMTNFTTIDAMSTTVQMFLDGMIDADTLTIEIERLAQK